MQTPLLDGIQKEAVLDMVVPAVMRGTNRDWKLKNSVLLGSGLGGIGTAVWTANHGGSPLLGLLAGGTLGLGTGALGHLIGTAFKPKKKTKD